MKAKDYQNLQETKGHRLTCEDANLSDLREGRVLHRNGPVSIVDAY
jgi:hypothetical protein